MTVFLDVGAHEGQTLQEAIKGRYAFDRIHAFEPMPRQYATLQRRYGGIDRVTLENIALGDRNGRLALYGDNENMGTSIYETKRDVDPTVVTEVDVVRASDWFTAHLAPDDQVIMKLNCEGAEVPILLDLCDSGKIHNLSALLIDFDVRKVLNMEDQEQRVLDRLRDVGFDRYVLSENVMQGPTHQVRIAAWLATIDTADHPGQ